MKPFARDMVITLTVKVMLLLLLWFFCFKSNEKVHVNPVQWLFGAPPSVQTYTP